MSNYYNSWWYPHNIPQALVVVLFGMLYSTEGAFTKVSKQTYFLQLSVEKSLPETQKALDNMEMLLKVRNGKPQLSLQLFLDFYNNRICTYLCALAWKDREREESRTKYYGDVEIRRAETQKVYSGECGSRPASLKSLLHSSMCCFAHSWFTKCNNVFFRLPLRILRNN